MTISGQPRTHHSQLHNMSVSSSSYFLKVGAATKFYAENLSTEQRTQLLSGLTQDKKHV